MQKYLSAIREKRTSKVPLFLKLQDRYATVSSIKNLTLRIKAFKIPKDKLVSTIVTTSIWKMTQFQKRFAQQAAWKTRGVGEIGRRFCKEYPYSTLSVTVRSFCGQELWGRPKLSTLS
jgi:hypothetical protein